MMSTVKRISEPTVKFAFLLGIIVLPLASFSEDSMPVKTLSLTQIIALAESRSAELQSVCSQQFAAAGTLKDAQAWMFNNPEITLEYRQRDLAQSSGPDVRRNDTGFGISQTFELGGQQSARRGAAIASLDATQQALSDSRRQIRAEAVTRFIKLLAAQNRIDIDEQALILLRQGSDLVQKRVGAGEESRLNGNLARVEMERSANQLAQDEELRSQARSDLATLLQLSLDDVPAVTGELNDDDTHYSLSELLATSERHPRLNALTDQERAAQQRLKIEQGATYPDLTVGLSYSPERGIDGQDNVTTLSFSLPLPLFQRNAKGVGQALTDLNQASIAHQSMVQSTRAQVRALWQRLLSLQKRSARLKNTIVSGLAENQALSLKALQAGEIGLPQFLLIRRQLLDSRLEWLDARTELRLTRIALEYQAGWPEQLGNL